MVHPEYNRYPYGYWGGDQPLPVYFNGGHTAFVHHAGNEELAIHGNGGQFAFKSIGGQVSSRET